MRVIDVNAVQRWLADWQYGEAPNPEDTKEEKEKERASDEGVQ